MSTAPELDITTPESDRAASQSMPPESNQQETQRSAPKEKKPRASRACDLCRQKKVRCVHRQPSDDDNESHASERESKQIKKSLDPAQPIDLVGAPGATNSTNTEVQPTQNNAESLETAASHQRPRRLGAGKRKLADDVEEIPPPKRGGNPTVAPEEPNASTTATNGDTEQKPKPQVQPRKKPGPKPRKQVDSTATATPHVIPDTPVASIAPVESSNPPATQAQALAPFNNTINMSIDLAWHKCMRETYEKHVKETEKKHKRWMQTVQQAQEQYQDLQHSMEATHEFMDKWASRFVNRFAHLQ